MEQIELKASNRETLGKKVRFLRRQGITPVHLFGHGIESLSLQCDTAQLRQVLSEAGHTKLINLKVAKEKSPRTTVVREIQPGHRPGELFHVDFYQVEMEVAMKVDVPIVLTGEAPALSLKENTLVQEINTLSVECLPTHIPDVINLDISSLSESDQSLRVRDIQLDDEITVLNEPEVVLVRISKQRAEIVEEEMVTEEAVETPEEAETPDKESAEE